MNKKGIILSVYIYVLLIFFLLVLASLLVVLSNTKKLTQRIKDGTESIVDSYEYGFSIDIEGPETICNIFGEDYEEPGFIAKDDKGNTLNVTIDSNLDIWKTGTYEVNYIVRFNNKEKKVTRKVVVYKPDLKYTGSYQTFTVPCSGIYKVETWGAAGDTRSNGIGGKGAYAKGEIYLEEGTKLYVYVGEGGKTVTTAPVRTYTFNGGGYQGTHTSFSARGGGATDIRLVSGNWNSSIGLKSRIIVAGAGGAGYNYGTGGTGGTAGG
ncbi:MAG: glycine-rich protein, partial [Bacilli bacterium]|nr:glycine-rich protein [Bacilli bacterium]